MVFMFLLVQTCGTEHSAVHWCVRITSSDRHVSQMQATVPQDYNKNWKTCFPDLSITPHQRETLIQPYTHYLAIIKKKLQMNLKPH